MQDGRKGGLDRSGAWSDGHKAWPDGKENLHQDAANQPENAINQPEDARSLHLGSEYLRDGRGARGRGLKDKV